MALIKCAECSKEVSDKAAACPGCGAPVAPPGSSRPTERNDEGAYANIWPDMERSGRAKGKGLLGLAGAVAAAFVAYSCVSAGSDANGPMKETKALAFCREAIRTFAKDPSNAKVPSAGATTYGETHHFTWAIGKNEVRLRNGFGMEIPASVSCSVNFMTRKVTSLTINGERVFGS